MEIRIEKYTPELKTEWDEFISSSRNGTFLFYRDFMEYHSDRFNDFSLLFFNENELLGVLPGNVDEDTLYSHQGLTYGGLILSGSVRQKTVLDIFDELRLYLKEWDITNLIYKAIPHIYHKMSCEEDLYALFRNDAKLIGRSVSSCIPVRSKIAYSELRNRGIRKANSHHLTVKRGFKFRQFWKILTQNLLHRFGVAPVHSLSEIEYLRALFPRNIHLFEVYNDDKCVGGCVVFETDKVAHIQYISASPEGRELGALDYLFDYLIQNMYSKKPFFEFGISTENSGKVLNEGLIAQKEGFGGRSIVYDVYQLIIS
ncbi:GNAT family N-acetyltransferase [Dysgonomonas sp. OttesenSCG-928-M03]|nr:GNAT family N-acetyltransferase [Dysgonomonas sp. OttesenSCG-928-M03]